PRSSSGPHVPRGAGVNARLGLAARAAFTLLLAWLVLYPIVIVVHDAAASSDALAAFVSRPGEWWVLWASVWISAASVALAAAIGVPLAVAVEWVGSRGGQARGAPRA